MLASILCLCATPTVAHAAGANAAAAEALFNEAKKAMQEGDLDTACSRFLESDKLDPAEGTKLNLAACETQRGNVATAWELFREVLEKLPADDPRRDFASEQAQTLEGRLPKLVLRLAAGAPEETSVAHGEAEYAAAAFGVPLPIDPGKQTLTVRAPGHEDRVVEVVLVEGETQELEVVPGAAVEAQPAANAAAQAAGAASAPEADAGTSSGSSTLGWVLTGVGVAGLGTGVVGYLLASGELDTWETECDHATKTCSQAGIDAADKGETYDTIATVGLGVGVVGLGAGAYFLLSSGGSNGAGKTALVLSGSPERVTVRVRSTW